jgi:hypothetical protein
MTAEPALVTVPDAAEDEAAAVLAALTRYLAATAERGSPAKVDRWARAGRLEAMRLPVTPETLRRGWRA